LIGGGKDYLRLVELIFMESFAVKANDDTTAPFPLFCKRVFKTPSGDYVNSHDRKSAKILWHSV